MATYFGIICSWLSATLFLTAFLGMVYVGIRRLIRSLKEGKSALIPALPNAKMDKKDYRKLFLWLFISTLMVYVIGMAGQMLQSGGHLSLHDAFLRAFQKSDALHYIEIAKNGYTAVGETRYFIVFFPLFPLLVRIFAFFTFGHYILASVLLNFILMYIALIFIFRLGIMDFPRDTVWGAVGLLLLFPLAFFFHNAYTEPLFLMTSAASLYHTRKDNYALAGVFGFCCALSRASGVLCAVPLVARSFIGSFDRGKFHPLQWLQKAAFSLVTLSGTGVYLLLNYVVTGNAFMFLVHQSEHWYNGFKLFPNAVRTVSERMVTNIYPHHTAMWVSQFLAIFLFLALLVLGIRRLSTEMSFYNCAFFLMMISQSWLLSGPRYLMSMFPAFFVLSSFIKHKVWRGVVFALFATGLLIMTYLFAINHSIY